MAVKLEALIDSMMKIEEFFYFFVKFTPSFRQVTTYYDQLMKVEKENDTGLKLGP